MVQFVKPNLLGKYNEYLNRFVNPITNGQYEDSTPRDIQMMKKRSHILHKLLDGCVQRRDYSVLAPYLPIKHEYVVSIQLTPLQVKLYEVIVNFVFFMRFKERETIKIFLHSTFALSITSNRDQFRTIPSPPDRLSYSKTSKICNEFGRIRGYCVSTAIAMKCESNDG